MPLRSVFQSAIRAASRTALASGQETPPGAPEAPSAGVDLIEAQFYGLWSGEADWFTIGPEGASSLDELQFFRQ